jgi:hypothetical protein
MKVLGHGTRILQVDVLRSDLHVTQGSLDLGVTHQVHERGQADSGAYHVGGKGVTEAVGIGKRETAHATGPLPEGRTFFGEAARGRKLSMAPTVVVELCIAT